MLSARPSEAFEVFVTSLEPAEYEVAELWVGGARFGETLLRDGRVVLHIEPRADGRPWQVDAHELRLGLARAAELLGSG
jgi:hypothetical protein